MPDIRLYPRDQGRGAHDVQLRATYGTRDIYARERPRGAGWGAHDIQLYPAAIDRAAPPAASFPTQFAGLRTWHSGALLELCLVATADAPTGMGGQLRVSKGGTTYAVYLVETSDPNASPVRVRTSAGVKAIRRKT